MRERHDARLPGMNQRVLIRPPAAERDLPSRVEDHTDGDVVVAAPVDERGALVAVDVGAAVRMRWAGRIGPSAMTGVVVAVGHGPLPLWRIRPVSITTQPQRREYARGAFDAAATIRAGGSVVPVRLMDLSEGGLRCRTGAGAPLGAGEQVVVGFDLDGVGLLVPASVLRHGGEGDEQEAVLVFDDIPDSVRDRIRRAVFARQRAELKR